MAGSFPKLEGTSVLEVRPQARLKMYLHGEEEIVLFLGILRY
jgi:hypothetical protein